MPEHADHRLYGAVAYLKATRVGDRARRPPGLFAIRATGSSAGITNAEGSAPRTFGRRTPAPGGGNST